MRSSAAATVASVPRPIQLPFKLRHVMAAAAVVMLLWQGVPRAKAAWRLQSLATDFADYALCMVGPTGPTLLRDNAPEFWSTVRRRLVASPADTRPFQLCAALAETITSKVEVRRAHDSAAREFVEYGADGADRAARGAQAGLTLNDLEVNTHPLAELAKEAYPFSRTGYTVLVNPSLSAVEALHPAELPHAVVGRGLPASRVLYRSVQALGERNYLLALGAGNNLSAYKTNDGGVNWQEASVRDPRVEAMGGRCFGEDSQHYFMVGLDESRLNMKVASVAEAGVVHTAQLPRGMTQVMAVGCDDGALVAALLPSASRNSGDGTASLFLCPRGEDCRAMPSPAWGEGLALGPLDVQRVAGATVVAIARHGLVRTASSRDNGRSWTPFVVAFDQVTNAQLRVQIDEPSRLLVLGKRVLLYGGAPRPGMTYPVLVSDDLGASWRSP